MKAGQTHIGSLKVFLGLLPLSPSGIENTQIYIYSGIERVSAKSLFVVRQGIYPGIMKFFQALSRKKEFFYRFVFLGIARTVCRMRPLQIFLNHRRVTYKFNSVTVIQTGKKVFILHCLGNGKVLSKRRIGIYVYSFFKKDVLPCLYQILAFL
jgi:hypothetical protein